MNKKTYGYVKPEIKTINVNLSIEVLQTSPTGNVSDMTYVDWSTKLTEG